MRRLTLTILAISGMTVGAGPATAQSPVELRPAVLVTEAVQRLNETVQTLRVRQAGTPIAVIDRLLSFDADSDHRIAHGELPERMQDLVARGDENQDGVLDSEEIRRLVSSSRQGSGFVQVRTTPSDGLPGVIDDLKLPTDKHERAMAIVKANPAIRNVNDAASRILESEMRALLDDEEYENFEAARARLRSVGGVFRFSAVVR